MNGRNRHNKYRNGVYRRRNIGIIVLISVVAVAVFLAAFLVIGNLLHKQSENRNNSDETDTSEIQSNSGATEKTPTQSIIAHSVLLETSDSTFFSDRLDALLQKEVYAASVPLNTTDGALLFRSTIADKLGYPVKSSGVTLKTAVSAAEERGVYLSGIFYLNAFENDNALLRSVELSEAAAIISEALTAGFDDVVIVTPHLTAEQVEEAIRFVENIEALTENGVIGLTVSDNIFELENSQMTSQLISLLDSKIDFLAMDTSSVDTSEGYGLISDKINEEKLYLHMYKMRVLLPYDPDEEKTAEIISAAENNGIKNFKIIQ